MLTIGQRIRLIRGKTTQSVFAEQFAVHKNTLLRWEKGEILPDITFIIKLTTEYAISLEWLLLGEGPQQKAKQQDSVPLSVYSLREKYSKLMQRNIVLKDDIITKAQHTLQIQPLLMQSLKADVNTYLIECYLEAMLKIPDAVLRLDIKEDDPDLIEIIDPSLDEIKKLI